jgi:hypothetical protein
LAFGRTQFPARVPTPSHAEFSAHSSRELIGHGVWCVSITCCVQFSSGAARASSKSLAGCFQLMSSNNCCALDRSKVKQAKQPKANCSKARPATVRTRPRSIADAGRFEFAGPIILVVGIGPQIVGPFSIARDLGDPACSSCRLPSCHFFCVWSMGAS